MRTMFYMLFIISILVFSSCGNSNTPSNNQESPKIDSVLLKQEAEERNEVQQDAIRKVIEYDTLNMDSVKMD